MNERKNDVEKSSIASDVIGQTTLLLGNEAIARGAIEAGARVAAAYPGTPSSEILENLAKVAKEVGMYTQWSTNEKVALEVVAAASMAGLRGITATKAQGLNVALDFLMHLNLIGTRGGLVIVVCDDPRAHSSVNEQDSRWFARMGDYPLLEPSSGQEAKDMVKWAFELSEELNSAILLRSVTRISHASWVVTFGEIKHLDRNAEFPMAQPFQPNPVVQKHSGLKQKIEKAVKIFESSPFNWYHGPELPQLTVVCSGTGWFFALDAIELLGLENSVGIIKLGTTWPLPIEFILKHLRLDSDILVAEEVDGFIEASLKELLYHKFSNAPLPKVYGKSTGHISMVGELDPDTVTSAVAKIMNIDYRPRDLDYDKYIKKYSVAMTVDRPSVYCPGCPHRASFWALKKVLRWDGRNGFLTGDIGCYGIDRGYSGQNVTRTQSCMGGGIGLASGFGKLEQFGFHQPVLSVAGDSTFFHATLPGLINAVHHKVNVTFVVLDNSTTGMTGLQPHPGTMTDAMGDPAVSIDVEKVCRSLGCRVEVVSPFDLEETQEKLRSLLNQEDTNVIIMRHKCALLTRKEGPEYRVWIDQQKCLGEECGCDRYCTRIFKCPGLIWERVSRRAKIDEAMCSGCGFCIDICPQNAIIREKVEA